MDTADWVLVEMVEIEQQTRQDREERALGLAQANKELLRNLAHEIKNPLGGIRGAAQLLEMELNSRPTGLARLRAARPGRIEAQASCGHAASSRRGRTARSARSARRRPTRS